MSKKRKSKNKRKERKVFILTDYYTVDLENVIAVQRSDGNANADRELRLLMKDRRFTPSIKLHEDVLIRPYENKENVSKETIDKRVADIGFDLLTNAWCMKEINGVPVHFNPYIGYGERNGIYYVYVVGSNPLLGKDLLQEDPDDISDNILVGGASEFNGNTIMNPEELKSTLRAKAIISARRAQRLKDRRLAQSFMADSFPTYNASELDSPHIKNERGKLAQQLKEKGVSGTLDRVLVDELVQKLDTEIEESLKERKDEE